jgi:hypothetical protein
MDNIDVYLAIVLNIDAVIYAILDRVVATVDVVYHIALVAVDVAKIQVLLGRTTILLNRMLRLDWRMNFSFLRWRLR